MIDTCTVYSFWYKPEKDMADWEYQAVVAAMMLIYRICPIHLRPEVTLICCRPDGVLSSSDEHKKYLIHLLCLSDRSVYCLEKKWTSAAILDDMSLVLNP